MTISGKTATAPIRVVIVAEHLPDMADGETPARIAAMQAAGLSVAGWALSGPRGRDDFGVPVIHPRVSASQRLGATLRDLLHLFGRPGFGAAWAASMGDAGAFGPRKAFRGFVQCGQLLRMTGAVDLFYAISAGRPAAMARMAALASGARWALQSDGDGLWTMTNSRLGDLLRSASFTVAASEGIAERMRAVNARAHVLAVPDATASAHLPPALNRALHRGDYAIDALRFVGVGALEPRRGWRVLLDALAELPPKLHWTLEHFGLGTQAGALRARARDLGLGQRVQFRGLRPHEEVLQALREASVFVAPSAAAEHGHETLSAAMIEAATLGTAIIATRTADVTGFLEQEKSALLVREGHVLGFADALARLARDPVLRTELGAAARARALKLHDAAPVSLVTAQIYKSLGRMPPPKPVQSTPQSESAEAAPLSSAGGAAR